MANFHLFKYSGNFQLEVFNLKQVDAFKKFIGFRTPEVCARIELFIVDN